MACDTCEQIANEVQCQGCADEILIECSEYECPANQIIRNGEINGHQINL